MVRQPSGRPNSDVWGPALAILAALLMVTSAMVAVAVAGGTDTRADRAPGGAVAADVVDGAADVVDGAADASHGAADASHGAAAPDVGDGAPDRDGGAAADRAPGGAAADASANQVADDLLQQAPPNGTLAGQVNLTDADTTLAGAAANDSAGWSVASPGDVNGDGVDDVVVGAPANDSAASNAGAVYLFYGPLPSGTVSVSDADVTLFGTGSGDRAGYSVAGGDVNGDGFADVVVGAPTADAQGRNSGAVYVVYGGPSLPATTNLADAGAVVPGAAAGDLAGFDVAVVGDRYGGPGEEVLVGAPRVNGTGPFSGAAYLLGNETLTALVSLADADVTLLGGDRGDLAGWSVAAAGDVNGDSRPDIAVGARRADDGGRNAGTAYVVTDVSVPGTALLPTAGTSLVGTGAGDNAGWAVAGAGDTDGDGYDDVVVGAPFEDSGGPNAGAAYLVRGASSLPGQVSLSNAAVTYVGSAPGDRAGWSVASAGPTDAACDGRADVLVGAPLNNSTAVEAGAAYLVYGDAGASGVRDLATADATIAGAGAFDAAGWDVAPAGDVYGDGTADVLVGAPFNFSAGPDAGAAYAVAGRCPVEPTPTKTATPKPTPTKTATPKPTPTKTATPKPTPTKTATPAFEPDVTFDCTVVTVAADRYDRVYLTFADGTHQTFTGPFRGTNLFGGTGANDGKVVRTVRVSLGKQTVTVQNPNLEACLKTPTKTATPKPTKTATPTPTKTPKPTPTKTPKALQSIQVGDVVCERGDGAITFTNPNDVRVKVIFDLQGAERQFAILTLEPRGQPGAQKTVRNLPDGTFTFTGETFDGRTVPVDGKASATRTVDCDVKTPTKTATPTKTPKPTPTETATPKALQSIQVGDVVCEDGDGAITFTNPNDQVVRVIFDLQGAQRQFAILRLEPAGQPGAQKTVEDLPDGVFTFTGETADRDPVPVDGQTSVTRTVECDAETPTKTPTEPKSVHMSDVVCRDGDGAVTFTNPNDFEVRIQLDIEAGEEILIFTLEPAGQAGAQETVEPIHDGTIFASAGIVRGDVDGVVDRETLLVNGMERATREVDCDVKTPTATGEPELEQVTVQKKCLAGDGAVGEITVNNPNAVTVQVDVAGPGDYENRVFVEPGAMRTTTFNVFEDGEYTVTTLSAGDENVRRIGQESVTIDCDEEANGDGALSARFFGCGNVELSGPDSEFPVTVRLVTFNPGQGPSVGNPIQLNATDRPGSPGGQLIGIYLGATGTQGFVNTNWNAEQASCSGAAGGTNPAEGAPGDPLAEVSSNAAARIPWRGATDLLGSPALLAASFLAAGLVAVRRRDR